ncbi:chemotaxis protein CheW [Methylobacterium sp. Leaf118]|uniref:chemotaxis protein CheW n=1 Tax=Methylobacterium sp. Leaf118 TaxID=2876562 RepID=UPI001E46F07E|nr:chemotaxis protein CheW [Methylobacterium sp. Leaf118]
MASAAYLLLDVAGIPCALPQSDIREVLPLPRLHAPPEAGGPLAGLLNLGGAPVPVVDLAALFGLRATDPSDPYRHVVLAGDRRLGLLVDRALDMVRVPEGSLRPVAPDRSLNGCVVAEFAQGSGQGAGQGSRLVHLLSLARILSREERVRLDALAERARARLTHFAVTGAA